MITVAHKLPGRIQPYPIEYFNSVKKNFEAYHLERISRKQLVASLAKWHWLTKQREQVRLAQGIK